MSRHTPGPWTSEETEKHGYHISGSGQAIARVWAGTNTAHEVDANAALIAAAPALLSACKVALLRLDRHVDAGDRGRYEDAEAAEQLRKAIDNVAIASAEEGAS